MALELRKKAIILVNLGTVRNSKGHEQALTRPCVVIKPLNALKLATIVPLSTNKPSTYAGSPVKISKGTANLNKDSFVLIHQIRTISTERIIHEIGQLPESKFEEVKQTLKHFLDL